MQIFPSRQRPGRPPLLRSNLVMPCISMPMLQAPSAPATRPSPYPARPVAPSRFLSVDILRGATVALMIIVNTPGDWDQVYPDLCHAAADGWTVADLVFPNFLFLVGASSVFSTQAALFKGTPRRAVALRLVHRSLRLVALQLVLTALPSHRLAWPELRNLRLYGVLTRTALCAVAVGCLSLVTTSIPVLSILAATLLTVYWALLRFVPVPGHGLPTRDIPLLDPERNLAAYLDRRIHDLLQRTLHTGALYHGTHDPEGLLSTIPALATCLLGACAALWLQGHTSSNTRKRNRLVLAGLLLLLGARLGRRRLPINKTLWTSTYVLLTGGISLLVLAALYHAADVKRLHKRSHLLRVLDWPWIVFGANAITAYAASGLLEKLLSLPSFARQSSLGQAAYQTLFARGRSTPARSLAYAVAFATVCFLPNLFLWRKRIFIKI